jgi:hypothetical protein
MDRERQLWSDGQQRFRRALVDGGEHQQAVDLFLQQHAALHSAALTGAKGWSFEDEVWAGLSDQQLRRIPAGAHHSVAWLIWHIARTEDVTINRLLAEQAQVFHKDQWASRLKVAASDIGTAMPPVQIAEISQRVDLRALRAYRLAVGRRTRQVVQSVKPAELRLEVGPERVRWAVDEGALLKAAADVGTYWGRHTKANLLLIPATRHAFTHLNEARRLRAKLR